MCEPDFPDVVIGFRALPRVTRQYLFPSRFRAESRFGRYFDDHDRVMADDARGGAVKMFARRPSLSIQARLTMLTLVTALPLVVLAGFAMIRTVDDERAQAERDVRERVEDLLADVDSQISAIQAELQVLALSPSLQAGDLAAFDRQMREALTIRGTSIVLHDTNAQQLVSTNRPFGEPLPRAREQQPNAWSRR